MSYTLEQLRWGQKFTSKSNDFDELLQEAINSIDENYAIPLSIRDNGNDSVKWSRNGMTPEESLVELRTMIEWLSE